jgi:hypothetical protein
MRLKMIACVLAVALLSAIGSGAKDDNEGKKEKSRKMAEQTLQDLYKLDPHLRQLSRSLPDTQFLVTRASICCSARPVAQVLP